MNKAELVAIKKSRLSNLKANGRNIKSPGVIRKLSREIRNLEK